MRPIPSIWTRAEQQVTSPDGRSLRLRLWGWSASSLAEARQVASERLAAAVAKVRAGQPLGGGYYPRLPLREETLTEVRDAAGELLAVITRNRYGAEVLNTDRVLVADVDLPEPGPAGGFLGRLLRRSRGAAPDPAAEAVEHITAFARTNPGLGVRIYRTAAGLRVLVTGTGALPGSPEAERILLSLRSDPVYVTLCATHETYRARLTPKPWRVGVPALTVRWPYDEGPDGERRAREWVEAYRRASAGHGTCHLLSRHGPAPSAAESMVVDVHDRASLGDPARLA